MQHNLRFYKEIPYLGASKISFEIYGISAIIGYDLFPCLGSCTRGKGKDYLGFCKPGVGRI